MGDLFLVLFLVGVAGAALAIAGSLCNLVLGFLGLSLWQLFSASVGLSTGAFFIAVVVGVARSEVKDASRSGN